MELTQVQTLTQEQISQVWENMLAAETRSLYFGDLTARYTRQKQWITGSSFFLASGAAATLISKAPDLVPLGLAIATALVNAYAMAVNLDGRIATMAKLHSSWNQIATDYDRLWNHTYDEDAESQLEEIFSRERDASELATTDAPDKPELLAYWQQRVFALHKLKDQSV
jgi:hypothetical protein